jgi:hypothetical protein
LISSDIIGLIDGQIIIEFLDEQLDEFQKTSEKRRNAANKRWSNASALQVQSKSNAIREDKIREDKIREDNSIFSFSKSLIELGVQEPYLSDWMKVRKEKKATNTETALKAFLTSVEKSGKTVNEVVKICAENSWKGFNKDWLNNSQPNQKNNVPTFDTNR